MAAMIRPGLGKPEVLPSRFYDPHAITRKNAIFQMAHENRRIMGTLVCPSDPATQVKAYREYCAELAAYRAACMTQMANVLMPSSHIYASMNKILIWMAREMRRATVPLLFVNTDPDDNSPETWPLDAFANYMIRTGCLVRTQLLVADRVDLWILIHHGAQDCHATTDVDMHLSAICHGLSQAGKSWIIKCALDKTLIEDTVTSILQSSDKAWNVHEDSIGLIIFKVHRVVCFAILLTPRTTLPKDEVENIWVDSRAAERDTSGAAERLKSMTSDQRTTYRALVFIEMANGRPKREAETIESLFHATLWCATNKMVGGGDEAIASRFFNFVMTRSETNLYEMNGIKVTPFLLDGVAISAPSRPLTTTLKDILDDEDEMIKKDAIHAWRVKQALLALCLVLIDSGVLPRPSMDVFDKLQARILSYLGVRPLPLIPARERVSCVTMLGL